MGARRRRGADRAPGRSGRPPRPTRWPRASCSTWTAARSASACSGRWRTPRRRPRSSSASWPRRPAPPRRPRPSGPGPTGRPSASSPGSARPTRRTRGIRSASPSSSRSACPRRRSTRCSRTCASRPGPPSSTSRPGAAPTRASRARPRRSRTATRASCSSTRSCVDRGAARPRGPRLARPLVGARAPVRDRRRLPELPRRTDLDDWDAAYHGANRERLLAVKRRYDPDERLRLSAPHSTADRSRTPSLRRACSRSRANGCSSACRPFGIGEHDHDRAAGALDRRRLGVAAHDRERGGLLRRRHGQPDRAPVAAEVARRRLGLRAAQLRLRRRRRAVDGLARRVVSAGPPLGYRSALASRCSPLSS